MKLNYRTVAFKNVFDLSNTLKIDIRTFKLSGSKFSNAKSRPVAFNWFCTPCLIVVLMTCLTSMFECLLQDLILQYLIRVYIRMQSIRIRDTC